MDTKSHDKTYQPRMHGLLALPVALALVVGAIFCFVEETPPLAIAGVVLLLLALLSLLGMTLVNPNHARVVLLFGRYVGSIRKEGFYWVNPFMVRKDVSLRVRNFESGKLKVNDELGNPIEIAAIIVWRVKDTAQALLDVENFEDYVHVQSEAALRQLATHHPYDSKEGGETSLRGSTEQVNDELLGELSDRLQLAGIEVLETRLSHLAYASEIAGAMLRRQQAEAIISARKRIVEGAVSMVHMALEELQKGDLELDDERKAHMVGNLLVVLCADKDVTPVVNTGTLYG